MSDQHNDSEMSDQQNDSLRAEIERFQYKPGDSKSDVRNVLLVVATLIAAITFQAGVNPPGGVWQDNSPPPSSYDAGKAILGYTDASFAIFLLTNTAAFSTSATIIGILVQGFPFYYLVWLALLLMDCTYVASVSAVLPGGVRAIYIVYLCMAFLLPFILVIVRHLWRRI
ncbi:Protein ACCELERATED CELL DEATH like [Fagus crenata]